MEQELRFGLDLGQLAVLKKRVWADYEQLLRLIFSCFQGQVFFLFFFFLGWLRAGTVHYGCEIISEESLFLFICFTVWAVKKVITEKFHGGRFLWNRN